MNRSITENTWLDNDDVSNIRSAVPGSEHKHHSGPMTAQQRLIVLLLLGTGFMLSVDFSILNIALPKVGSAVGLSLPRLPWISTAFALPAAGFTLLFGRIGDLFGRRRMFLIGITLLGLSSAFGGLAANATMLLLARALQGFATAIATPASLSLLITSFSEERQRARVLGFRGALSSGGFTVGALVGGAVIGALSWRWAFLINVPVAILILAISPFVIRASHSPAGVKLDVPGAIFVSLGLLALVFGITDRNGFALVSGLAMLGVFLLIEMRAKAPLVTLSLLSQPTVKWGNIATLVVFSMEPAFIYQMTLYLQEVMHFSPQKTGVIFGIPGLAAVAAGILAGRLVGRHGSRAVLTIGLLAQAGFVAPMIMAGTSSLWLGVLVPCLFLGFFGHVTAIVACVATATSGVPDSKQGLATGLVSMSQQVGITVGIPLLSAVAATQKDLLGGIHAALALDVVLTTVAAVLIWTGLRSTGDDTKASETVLPEADKVAA